MQRYLITNPVFSGSVEVGYSKKHLITIDFSKAQMQADIMKRFKAAVPVMETHLKESFGMETTIIAAEYIVTFDMFWNDYCLYKGNRITLKVNKKRTLKTWNNTPKEKQIKAHMGIAPYDNYLKKESWRSKADPDTYLLREMYEDEY